MQTTLVGPGTVPALQFAASSQKVLTFACQMWVQGGLPMNVGRVGVTVGVMVGVAVGVPGVGVRDGSALGPPPTNVGQVPQPSTTVRCTVVGCPPVAGRTVKLVVVGLPVSVCTNAPVRPVWPPTSTSALTDGRG